MKVKDAMHERPISANLDTSILTIARIMQEHEVGVLPIEEDKKLVGIVTDRDITCRAFADTRFFPFLKARDIMSAPALSCYSDDDVEVAIKIMQKNKIGRLPVVDTSNRIVGMLSIGDISEKMPSRADELIEVLARHHL